MFDLLSADELQELSDIELLDMLIKLSQAIRETKSMNGKDSTVQKLYHSLELEREHRKINGDGTQKASV